MDWCPYLEQGDGRRGTKPSFHYRCCVQTPAERVGRVYQARVCLTPDYRHCQRLALAEPRQAQESDARAAWSRPSHRRPEVVERGLLKQVKPRQPKMLDPAQAGEEKPRRPLTATEIAVMGLLVSIFFTCVFVGYAIVYRLRIGPGMGAAPIVAEGPGTSPTQTLATLVPTFTPTPLATAPQSAADVPRAPTSIPEPTLPLPTPVVRLPATSPPTRLVIPSVGVDVPVLTVGTKVINDRGKSKLIWADVPNAGGFHETSAYPGNPGNTVINGHRDIFGAVFRHLNNVEVGDEIVAYVGDVAYPYQVVETLVVPETFASAKQRAENLKYIGYMPEERLTLVTCTPPGLATHRLLIIAKPPGQIEPQMPEAGSTPGS